MDEPEALYSKQCSLKQPLRTDSGSLTEVSVLRFNYRTSFNCVCLSALPGWFSEFQSRSVDRLYNYSGQKSCYLKRENIICPMEIIGKIEALCVLLFSSYDLSRFSKSNLSMREFHVIALRWISSKSGISSKFCDSFSFSLYLHPFKNRGTRRISIIILLGWAHKFLINSNQIPLIKRLFVRTLRAYNQSFRTLWRHYRHEDSREKRARGGRKVERTTTYHRGKLESTSLSSRPLENDLGLKGRAPV